MIIINEWKNFLKLLKNIVHLFVTIILLPIILFLFSRFLLYIEGREGVVFRDPIFNYFTAVNVNYLIFGIIYFSILFGFVYLLRYPVFLIIGLQAYILLVIFRIISMYVVPLNPPIGTIDLEDPFVFILGTGRQITKDLFFSGHTSTLFLIFLCLRNKYLKIVFLIFTITVAFLLILQKVHYTIDVLVAPFYSYTCYRIIYLLHKVEK